MARDWDNENIGAKGSEPEYEGASSSIGVDRKQLPMEDALIGLDMAISKLDKYIITLLTRLRPVSYSRDAGVKDPGDVPSPPNSQIVSNIKEYQRRIEAITHHITIAIDELEI